MSRVLLLYSTTDGHTTGIADALERQIKAAGHAVDRFRVEAFDRTVDWRRYDAYVVGGSVHRGAYGKALEPLIRAHADELNRKPSWFYSVCLAVAHADPKDRAEAQEYVDGLLARTGWRPRDARTFGGALLYTRYGWLTRRVMRRIAEKNGLSTDTSRDHDYTDWEAVTAYAREIGDALAREVGIMAT